MILEIIQTTAVVLGVIVANEQLNNWRLEMIGKKKSDLAEDVLTKFYEIDDVIKWVRHPASYADEGETREAEEHEEEDTRHTRNMYFIPVERLNNNTELFSQLRSLKYQFAAYFGHPAKDPFDKIYEVHSHIVVSSGMLMSMSEDKNVKREDIEKWKSNIWSSFDEDDPIASIMEKAIQDIENICVPYLMQGAPLTLWQKVKTFLHNNMPRSFNQDGAHHSLDH